MLLYKDCTIKNVNKTFPLKTPITFNGFNVIFAVICLGCLGKYIGETGVGSTHLKDRVRVYRQHLKQSKHLQLKVEKHIRVCRKDS